jgi:glycosyltransferase involved in cell wall biosynthesis
VSHPIDPQPRVLQVVLSLHPGGTERLVLDLASRLNDVCPTAVCCLDDEGAWASELTAAGIAVTALHRASGFRPSISCGVARAARAHRATVVHAHHYSPFVYGALARFCGSQARVVFTEHGRLSDAGPSLKRRQANRVLARFSDATFTVSDNVRQHLVGEGFSPRNVGVIYNGIDVGTLPDADMRAGARRELGAAEDTCIVGTIARLDPVKDLGVLVRAIGGMHDSTVLVVVGDGPEREALEALARQLGIAHRIRFLGYRSDARRWLAGCDVYANSSVSEGVSLTILEAMAAGLPVVATSVGGTPEVVDDSCGLLVPSRDVDAMAAAISTLARDRPRRTRLAAAARRRVDDRFDLRRMVQAYLDVYIRLSSPPTAA